MTFFQHFFRRSCFNFYLFFILVVSNGLCLKYEPNSWQKTSTALWRLFSSIEQSINHREKSKFLTKHFAPVWNCRHIPPLLPFLTGVDKPIETLTIRKHANAVLSKVQHTQPDAIVATTSSYFFHRLLYFISPPPCACRIAVSARFCAFPPCLHIIPFRESLIHQTLSVITHQTEKKQPFTRRCETLSLSLVYGPYIYILGPYAGYICVGGKARGSLNAHLGYFVNKPRPSARALYSGRGLLGL